MTRQTRTILYHLLPVAFWLLAAGVCLIAQLSTIDYQLSTLNSQFSILNYLPAVLVLIPAALIRRIRRHADPTEVCFVSGLFLGVAAYWLPTVLVMILPAWGYLIYRNLFSMHAFLATLIGLATVVIWIWIGNYFSLFTFHFSLVGDLYVWIPTLAFFFAWLGTVIVRQTLRER